MKEHRQAALMFASLVLMKAAKQPQCQKAHHGITCKTEAINDLEDSLDEEEYDDSYSEVAMG